MSIFEEAINLLEPVNKKLNGQCFLDDCLTKLYGGVGLKYEVSDKGEIQIPYNKSSVYMFWADLSSFKENNTESIKVLCSQFLDSWDEPTENISYFPKSNQERTEKTLTNIEEGDMFPFYLGKSQNIEKRVNQHLYLKAESSTYALKLKSRPELLKNIVFEITWLPLETTSETYFLVSRVESLLRDLINPIVGKQ